MLRRSDHFHQSSKRKRSTLSLSLSRKFSCSLRSLTYPNILSNKNRAVAHSENRTAVHFEQNANELRPKPETDLVPGIRVDFLLCKGAAAKT
jgi:hypothetical protein